MGRSGQQGVLGTTNRLLRYGTVAGFSDRQLLERFTNRHDEAAEAAFAAIVDRHGSMVLSVCQRILMNRDDAQDAFQATFLILVRQAGSVRRRDSLAAWLYGVALRVSARSKAAAARRRAVEQQATGRSAHGAESRDDLKEVWEEVDRLPRSLRTAVELCYFEGLTHEQAAIRLGWPVGTVRSRLTRAREFLRVRLARQGFGPACQVLGLLPARPAFASLPDSLIEPTVKAARLVAACKPFEPGVVSASSISLTEGVLRAMFLAKFLKIAVAITTGVLIVSASTFAFQQSSPGRDNLSTAPAQDQPSRLDPRTLRARKLAWYAVTIERRARSAGIHQSIGDFEAAAEDTETIQRLAHEWNWMVHHLDPEKFPESMYEPPLDPSSAPSTNAATSQKTTVEAVADPLHRSLPPAPSPADTQARLDAMERKLDMLIAEIRSRGTGLVELDSTGAAVAEKGFTKTQAVPKSQR